MYNCIDQSLLIPLVMVQNWSTVYTGMIPAERLR